MTILRYIALFAAGALAGRWPRRASGRAPSASPSASPEVAPKSQRRRRWLIRAAVGLPALALLGFLVAASGLIPITASSGHWAVTRWFLEFSMARSVATHSLGIQAPPLDDPAMVLKGAGHYETGCRPCHGSPNLRHPRIAMAMTPTPPNLSPVVSEWDPEELFYIVKHGVKLTGMPAWPSQMRDDEVWAMVAFLLRLPELDESSYRDLVDGELAPSSDTIRVRQGGAVPPMGGLASSDAIPQPVSASCGRCHGIDGGGRGLGAFPRLAGQRPNYLYAALEAYASGRRHSGIMQPIAAALSVDEMRAVARYYAGLPASPASAQAAEPNAALPLIPGQVAPGAASVNADTTSAASIARGRRIAMDGIPGEGIPSCRDCHGPTPTRRNPFYPNLAGQYAAYIRLQLELFQQDRRGGSPFAHLMHPTAERLTAQQIADVAAFYEAAGR